MKIKIIHPLWTHLPAVAVLIYFIVRLATGGPYPSTAPVHFNIHGIPDSYGSPWLVFGLILGLSVFYIVISIFLDEMWTRQEKRKSFNWLSLFDDVVVGVLVVTSLGNIEFLNSGADRFQFDWTLFGLIEGIAVAAAVLLEWWRPFHAVVHPAASGDTAAMEKEFEQKARENRSFIYWESQNPLYVTLLTVILPLILFVFAVVAWFSQPWAALVLFIVGLSLVIPYGGLRTVVTARDITIRFGLPGFRVLRISNADIQVAEIKEFSPLREFGGYGIRFNGQMTAYYMNGNRGVKLTTARGKNYLIGSDQPEQLLAVVRAVTASRR